MPRHLFSILCALSLVLCVATCVMWVRSYYVQDTFGWYINHWHGEGFIGSRIWAINSDSGGLLLFRLRRRVSSSEEVHCAEKYNRECNESSWNREVPYKYPYLPDHRGFGKLGFGWYGSPSTPPTRGPPDCSFTLVCDDHAI